MQSIKPIRPNSIVSANELNDIWQQMNSVESRFNPYENYIKKLQSEGVEDPSTNKKDRALIEKHHIIPRFDGGTNDSSNLVLVRRTIKEHVISHWIRWRVLAKPQDYAAFLFRIGDIEEAISQRNFAVRAARERDKKEGLLCIILSVGSANQKQEMGKRGGARGGSANTEQQYQARQQRQYGRQTGIKNQGQGLSEFISRYSIWAYSSSRNKSNKSNKSNLNRSQIIMREFYCIIEPKSAFIDIINCLNALVPNSISLSAFSFFIL